MTDALPNLTQAKDMAKALRKTLSEQGTQIGHAQALEGIARQYGFRDWNALHAAIQDQTEATFRPGTRVAGTYLSQPFDATVREATIVRPGWVRLSLELDQAVDVVRSSHFSNMRKRITCIVGPEGHTREKTSDGQPHVILRMNAAPTEQTPLR